LNKVKEKFPEKLDAAKDGACGSDNLCFTEVVQPGSADTTWTKHGLNYTFFCEGEQQTYTYNPQTGTFE
jgi:hypothetical protein